MNEQEKGIINDCIESIKSLVNFAIGQVAEINYPIEKKYRTYIWIVDMGEDTIGELEKVRNGQYGKPTEDLCCKGEE